MKTALVFAVIAIAAGLIAFAGGLYVAGGKPGTIVTASEVSPH